MRTHIGDGIKYRAYYVSSGRSNERIAKEGVGIVVSDVYNNMVTVDIGVREIKVHTSDITKNYGNDPPFTVVNK